MKPILLLCPLVAGLAVSIADAQPASFQPLGVYSGGVVSVPNSSATAVSNTGGVVAGFAMGTDPATLLTVTVALYRSASGQWQPIPGVGYSSADAVSANGSVIAGTGPLVLPSGMFSPFLYSVGGAATSMPLPTTRFSAISADGATVAGLSGGNAIVWSQSGGLQTLGHISGWNGTAAAATGISADGSAVVGSDTAASAQAFRWTSSGGMVGLGFLNPNPGSRDSEARAISADGQTVVGRSINTAGHFQGFVWKSNPGIRPLPLLDGATGGAANAVSADGSVIVGESDNAGTLSAYYWDRSRGRRDLAQFLTSLGATGLSGWTLTRATAISADGSTIVGDGTDPQGRSQAWMARIPAFCYANCDSSSAAPVLNVVDFICFQTRFANGDPYANCDNSTIAPTLNVNDFLCFQERFTAGCP